MQSRRIEIATARRIHEPGLPELPFDGRVPVARKISRGEAVKFARAKRRRGVQTFLDEFPTNRVLNTDSEIRHALDLWEAMPRRARRRYQIQLVFVSDDGRRWTEPLRA